MRAAHTDAGVGEGADEDRAEGAAHAVHAPDIEGVVPLVDGLELAAGVACMHRPGAERGLSQIEALQ